MCDFGIRLRAPLAYQTVERKRVPVNAQFAVDDAGRLEFVVKDYARNLPLTIDPVVSYTKILGTQYTSNIAAIAADASGSAIVVGTDDGPTGTPEIFVDKLDPTGTQLLYSTYISANAASSANAIALDPKAMHISPAQRPAQTFRRPHRVLDQCTTACNGGFITKFDGNGAIAYSTIVGVGPKAIVVDDVGAAYIAGDAGGGSYTVNAFQSKSNFQTCQNCAGPFFAKVNPAGTAFIFASYFSVPYLRGYKSRHRDCP